MPFVEKTDHSVSWASLLKINGPYTCAHTHGRDPVLLTYLLAMMLVPHCLDHYSFIISLKVR